MNSLGSSLHTKRRRSTPNSRWKRGGVGFKWRSQRKKRKISKTKQPSAKVTIDCLLEVTQAIHWWQYWWPWKHFQVIPGQVSFSIGYISKNMLDSLVVTIDY